MVQWLTCLGLAIIPFAILGGVGANYPKEVISIGLAGAISLYALQNGIFKPLERQGWIFLIFFMLISTAFSPKTGLILGSPTPQVDAYMMYTHEEVDNLWNFKPIFYAFLYLMMAQALASVTIGPLTDYLGFMAWAGGIVALIAILQHLGFNQFSFVRPPNEIGWTVSSPEMYSTMGQPTLLAAFAAICAIPALYIKNYWLFALIGIAIILTHSAFGLLGLVAGVALFIGKRRRWSYILALSAPLFLAVPLMHRFNDHGRFAVWQQLIHDLRYPITEHVQYGLFGYGPGAFHYLFPIMHSSPWFSAHNDFLEFLFNNGPLGFILLLGCLYMLAKECWNNFNTDIVVLGSMLIVMCLVAQGTFLFQLGACQFYAAVTVGLLYNRLRSQQCLF